MPKNHHSSESGAREAVLDSILARKLSVSVPLSRKEKAALAAVQSELQTVAAGEDLLVDGKRSRTAYVVKAGWAVRYKLLPDGRRQILNFVLPGDIVGFREYLFEVTPHSVGALTDLDVSTMNPAALTKLFYEYPKLALALALSASREAAMLEEQIVRIGRRNAYERLAHLFLELMQRLAMVGQESQGTFELPVTPGGTLRCFGPEHRPCEPDVETVPPRETARTCLWPDRSQELRRPCPDRRFRKPLSP